MAVGIDRKEKNIMRENLDDILRMHKEIETKIEAYRQEATVEEYSKFWMEFGNKNRQTMRYLSNYMARKANR